METARGGDRSGKDDGALLLALERVDGGDFHAGQVCRGGFLISPGVSPLGQVAQALSNEGGLGPEEADDADLLGRDMRRQLSGHLAAGLGLRSVAQAPPPGGPLLLSLDTQEAEGGQPGNERSSILARDPVSQLPPVEQPVGDGRDLGVAPVLNIQKERGHAQVAQPLEQGPVQPPQPGASGTLRDLGIRQHRRQLLRVSHSDEPGGARPEDGQERQGLEHLGALVQDN
eukprot:CAMPEP_0119142856 /NCGR_PEP_ID=MMETSP1310-20130426/33408_1 /TAXON_ID=464262 /ORGANISM="Genus nov. species nov., Strain RCC2339" /LENGTH=228 /DNA_ID=CAMNT_0007134433 /DNA_START=271 /DNA_END=954 /DNA_ORIENTATION=+